MFEKVVWNALQPVTNHFIRTGPADKNISLSFSTDVQCHSLTGIFLRYSTNQIMTKYHVGLIQVQGPRNLNVIIRLEQTRASQSSSFILFKNVKQRERKQFVEEEDVD